MNVRIPLSDVSLHQSSLRYAETLNTAHAIVRHNGNWPILGCFLSVYSNFTLAVVPNLYSLMFPSIPTPLSISRILPPPTQSRVCPQMLRVTSVIYTPCPIQWIYVSEDVPHDVSRISRQPMLHSPPLTGDMLQNSKATALLASRHLSDQSKLMASHFRVAH